MVNTYFEIGRLIIEHEQKGKVKAEYGEEILAQLSNQLTLEFGKGFSETNLKQMRTFYITYGKGQTPSAKFTLSWSHYVFLMRLDKRERTFYEIEATQNHWSLRELKRQFDTALFVRLRISANSSKESFLDWSDGGNNFLVRVSFINLPSTLSLQ